MFKTNRQVRRQQTTDPLILIGLAYSIFSDGTSSILNAKMQMRSDNPEFEAVLNVTFHCSCFLVRALGELGLESHTNGNQFRGLLISTYIHLMCENIHRISKTCTCFQEGVGPNLLYMLFALNSHLRILA